MEKEDFGFKIIFNNNISVLFNLLFDSEIITNNINVKYNIKLINNF